MSQRGCAGFNWPPLSIAAEEPISISPVAVSRAGPIIFDICVRLVPVIPAVIPDPVRSPSDAASVGQPVLAAAMFSVMFLAIGSYSIPRAASVTVGVCQPASSTKSFRLFDRSGLLTRSSPPDLESRICGVGQPVIQACRGTVSSRS